MASDVLIFNWIINHFYSICGFQGTYLMYVRSTKLDNTSLSFTNGLTLNSSVALRLVLIKLLSANGDGEIRTLDPLLARQVLSQLSYTPIGCGSSFLFFKKQSLLFFCMSFSTQVGLSGLEPPTSRLSGVRSNRLSYKPGYNLALTCSPIPSPV